MCILTIRFRHVIRHLLFATFARIKETKAFMVGGLSCSESWLYHDFFVKSFTTYLPLLSVGNKISYMKEVFGPQRTKKLRWMAEKESRLFEALLLSQNDFVPV